MAGLNQESYRWRNDDGSESTATWKAAEKVNITQLCDVNLRLRILTATTGTDGTVTSQPQLQYNKNSAGWNNVTASSSVARSSSSAQVADGASTSSRLTTALPDPNFKGGIIDTGDGLTTSLLMLTNGGLPQEDYREDEFCFQIRSVDVANNDTVQFRAVNVSTAYAAYTATPSLTVSKPATVKQRRTPGPTRVASRRAS